MTRAMRKQSQPSTKILLESARVALLVAMLGAILSVVVQRTSAEPRSEYNVIQEYPMARDGDAILLPATIAGTTYSFWLDTGSSCTIYDLSLRSGLGDADGVVTIESTLRAPIVAVHNASLGAFKLPGRGVLMDLTAVRRLAGRDIYGVIGIDFLSDKVFKLDFDSGNLQFLHSPSPDAGCEVKLLLAADGRFMVSADIDRVGPEWFLVDTGHIGIGSDGTLRPGVRKRLIATRAALPLGHSKFAMATGKQMEVSSCRISTVSLNDFSHDNLAFTDGEALSVLGNEYWRRYVATVDAPRRKMYLKPSSQFSVQTSGDRSGIHVLRLGVRNTIVGVDNSSPAALADLRAGDVIISVDGVDARTATPRMLRLRFCNAGTISLVIERSGTKLTKAISLKDEI